MNEHDLFRAIGDVDDTLLEGAEKRPRRLPRRYWSGLVAACLCVALLGLSALVLPGPDKSQDTPNEARTGDSAVMESASDAVATVPAQAPGEILGSVSAPSGVNGWGADPQSVEPTESYGDYPADFRFILTWEDFTYDSAGLLTLSDGQRLSLTLTPGELQQAWRLLSGLELTPGEGDISLTLTAHGQTTSTALGREDSGPVLSVCTELARLIQASESWPE